jgi:elongation factor P--beta-lysine ligase
MKTWQLLKQNPQLFQRYFVKEFLIRGIRQFFVDKNYHELESPILAPSLPQERYLSPLEVEINLSNCSATAYVIPTTERYNKIILAAGLGNHFVITKVARSSEELSKNHSVEFTMCEWYHLGGNYFDLMQDCEDLIRFLHWYVYDSLLKEKELNKFPISVDDFSLDYIKCGNYKIDIKNSFYRKSIPELLQEHCCINLEEIQNEQNFRYILKLKGYSNVDNLSWQEMFELVFAKEVEPNLPMDRPVFVYDYPVQVCVLTKQNEQNNLVCEKVELYIARKEIGNGYTELTDWKIQKTNFDHEKLARESLSLKPVRYDNELLDALKSGVPDVAGIGIGVDRLAMIFANAKSISEINYFPVNEWDIFKSK